MITSDIVNTINELEDKFPVDQWTINGIHIWPLVRNVFYFNYIDAYQAQAMKRLEGGSLKRATAQSFKMLRNNGRYLYACAVDRNKNASPSAPADVIFLSEGNTFSRIDNAWCEKFCSPLLDHFHNENLKSLMMTRSHSYLIPRQDASIFIQPFLDYRKIKVKLSTCKKSHLSEHLPGYADMIELTRRLQDASPMLSLSVLRQQALLVRSYADFYKSIFKKVKPRIGFVVCYYVTEGMAFNLACRESGIPSVDLQHGVAGDLCPPYGRWNKVPQNGYELLPSIYWCWNEADAAAIEKWNTNVKRWHMPLVGGNPWLNKWQQDESDRVKQDNRRHFTANSDTDHKYSANLLLTLQIGFDTGEPFQVFLDTMKSAPSDWCWWVRLHPRMVNEKERFREVLKENHITSYELDGATDFPLFELLQHTDVHITHSSATVMEAESFGVPSVITSSYGAEFFQREVVTGWAVAAYSPRNIIDAIYGMLRNKDIMRCQHKETRTSDKSALKFVHAIIVRNSQHFKAGI